MAAYGKRNREDMRLGRTRIYGAVKCIYLEIGSRFKSRGWIEHANDVFYLTTEEVGKVCKNSDEVCLKTIIEERKEELKRDGSAKFPDRIIYADSPPFFRSKKRKILMKELFTPV